MAEKIGQILIRKGKINPAQLREALRTQQFFGGYLGSHLINLGFIDEASLGETLSEIYGVPFAPFDSIRLARPDVLARVPSTLAQRFRLVPIHLEGNRLHVAMLNPRDGVAISELSSATGLNVTPWVAPEFRIIQALEKHYRLRKSGRGPIKVKEKDRLAAAAEAADVAARADAAPPTPSSGGYRRIDQDAVGLDGHPLGASVVPELGDTAALTSSTDPLPRSLEEWRDLDRHAVSGNLAHPVPRDTAAAASTASGFLTAAASPDQLTEALTRATDRNEVAREVVLFMASRFRRAAAFTVRQGQVAGWVGAGTWSDPESLVRWSAPLSSSLFSAVQTSRSVYLGPFPDSPVDRDLMTLAGGEAPLTIMLVPIMLRERLVSVLYADNETQPLGPTDVALWKRVSKIVEAAFEIMILRNKMKQA